MLKIPGICPLLQVIENGPFRPNWTKFELKSVLDTLANYFVPLTASDFPDWCEFRSLKCLLTKSTEFLVSFIIENISDGPNYIHFTIGSEHTLGASFTIPPNIEVYLKNRNSTLSSIRTLSMELPTIFKPQVWLSEKWTIEEDN